MPVAEEWIKLRMPHHSVGEILHTVLTRLQYRPEPESPGFLKAIKQETGAVVRASKFIRYELTLEWHALEQELQLPIEEREDLDPEDESNWPILAMGVRVEEKNNAWTGGKCAQEVNAVVEAITNDCQRWLANEKTIARDQRFGSARWATAQELVRQQYLLPSVEPDRFLVGCYRVAPGQIQFLTIPVRETERHALICGPTGCGKTSTIFAPNLIERIDASALVTEATPGGQIPDLFKKTAGWRKSKGHEIYYFNPDDLRSHRINPIDTVKTVSDAQELADILIRNTTMNSHAGDQVWETSERQLLTALVMIAATQGGDFASVRRMLTRGRKSLKAMVRELPAGPGRDECLSMFDLSTEGFLNGVMVGLMVRLSPWLSPNIAALTEKTDFDVSALPDQLFTFYLAVPAGNRQVKPVSSMILNFLLDVVLEQLRYRETFPRPFMMLLDELTNFGYIPDLPSQLTILRHAHIPIVLGMQDTEQLRKVYGHSDARIITSQPATRIFFKPVEWTTCKEISEQLGTATKADPASGRGGRRYFPRKLMTPDEVRDMRTDRAICFTPSTRPIKIWKLMPELYDERIAEHRAPLRDPIVVDESLLAYQEPPESKEIVEQAKKDYPDLTKPPASDEADQANLLKQNEQRNREQGPFKRSRAQKILDNMSGEAVEGTAPDTTESDHDNEHEQERGQ